MAGKMFRGRDHAALLSSFSKGSGKPSYIGRVFTMAPFFDIGNSWVLRKNQLTRQVFNSEGAITTEQVRFLPGTNSGFRSSTGIELQVMMPVVNAPFRLYWAYNPQIVQTYLQPPVVLDRSMFPNNATFLNSIAQWGQAVGGRQ